METTNATYPWYQHLVPVSVFGYVLGSNIFYKGQLPEIMAVHFNAAGQPNGTMTWAMNLTSMLILVGVVSVIDTVMRHFWARTAARYRFCAPVLLTTTLLAMFAWLNYCLIQYNLAPGAALNWNPKMAVYLFIPAIAFMLAVEKNRLKNAGARPQAHVAGLSRDYSDVQAQVKQASHFCVIQKSNPLWWNMIILLGVVVAIGVPMLTAQTAGKELPQGVVMLLQAVQCVIAAVLIVFFGGYTYIADTNGVRIKSGILGIPFKTIPLGKITGFSLIKDFSPLSTFMGYGWRINPKQRVTGYCLQSGDAVRIETGGWAYILVMPDAEAFMAIMKQARQTF